MGAILQEPEELFPLILFLGSFLAWVVFLHEWVDQYLDENSRKAFCRFPNQFLFPLLSSTLPYKVWLPLGLSGFPALFAQLHENYEIFLGPLTCTVAWELSLDGVLGQ